MHNRAFPLILMLHACPPRSPLPLIQGRRATFADRMARSVAHSSATLAPQEEKGQRQVTRNVSESHTRTHAELASERGRIHRIMHLVCQNSGTSMLSRAAASANAASYASL